MTKNIRLLGLTLGDPFKSTSWSGINNSIFPLFKEKCELIDVLDVDLKGIAKYWSAMKTFSFDRRKWGNRLHQNPWAFKARTQMIERRLKEITSAYDLIYQEGAMFLPGWSSNIPFVSYHDSNVILSAQGGGYAQGAHYKGINLQRTIEQEKMVYEKASIIFSMSDWLKTSFVKDFGIQEDKIITVYAGTTLKAEDFSKNYENKTILFVGKNFERKGGHTLLEAFKLVRKEIKDARLIIIGPDFNIDEEGVEVKGLVTNKNDLVNYFKQASLFVLPSLYEPFGLVFAEAFAFKNPCIGTNICAMPEIIEEGKGGFLIPPNDSNTLADRIILLLKDEGLSRKMGEYGFEKVKNTLNWDSVVNNMLFHCSKIV